MRCKCCDKPDAKFTLGDWYCSSCSSSINKTIKEDKEDWYVKDISKLAKGSSDET